MGGDGGEDGVGGVGFAVVVTWQRWWCVPRLEGEANGDGEWPESTQSGAEKDEGRRWR
nr:hypothetical protein [Tanacetum cinerariifolium]